MKLFNKNNVVISVIFGLSFIIGLIFLIMPFASKKPDGLNKVVEETLSFVKKDDFKPSFYAPMADYNIPGLKQKFDTKRYAGIIGVFVVFGISVFIGYVVKKRINRKI